MRPAIQQPISKDKNVMVQTRKYYLKNHYLTLRSKVKVPGRSLWYTTHCLMVMHPYQISLTYLKRNNYLTLRLKVKVQQRSLWICNTPPYGYAPTYQISLTFHHLMDMHPHTKYHWPISKETIICPWNQRSTSKQRSLWYTGQYGTRHTSYGHAPTYQISLTYLERQKNVMPRTRKYYLKKHYLTFRSKVKFQQVIMVCNTTLWTCTHIPNIIDLSRKKQLFDLEVKGQGPTKVIMVCDTPPYGHPTTYQISLTYLERNNHLTLKSKVKVQTKVIMVRDTPFMVMHPHTKYHWPISKDKKCHNPNKKILFKKLLFDLQDKGHYGMRHTALWSCTHIPNIIDRSRKKQLFDLEVKEQVPTKFITVRDTPPYGHTPTYQILLTYLKRKKCYGPDKKIPFKKHLFDLQVKGHGTTKVIMVRDTPPCGHVPTYQISLTYLERQKCYGPDKLR